MDFPPPVIQKSIEKQQPGLTLISIQDEKKPRAAIELDFDDFDDILVSDEEDKPVVPIKKKTYTAESNAPTKNIAVPKPSLGSKRNLLVDPAIIKAEREAAQKNETSLTNTSPKLSQAPLFPSESVSKTVADVDNATSLLDAAGSRRRGRKPSNDEFGNADMLNLLGLGDNSPKKTPITLQPENSTKSASIVSSPSDDDIPPFLADSLTKRRGTRSEMGESISRQAIGSRQDARTQEPENKPLVQDNRPLTSTARFQDSEKPKFSILDIIQVIQIHLESTTH